MTTYLLIALVVIGLLALHDEIRSRSTAQAPRLASRPGERPVERPMVLVLAAFDDDHPGERRPIVRRR